MRHWYLSLCMCGVWSADQTPPIQSDKYQCRIDTTIFLLMMGTWMPETCKGREINQYIKQNCAAVGFIYEIIQGCKSTKHKSHNLQM